jgi:hypothetical protein
MILRHSQILTHIAAGKSNKWIARYCGHVRHLIHQIRVPLNADPSQNRSPPRRNRPPCSPDLNFIEALTTIMKRRVEELQPKTKEELINVLIDVWETLDMSLSNALADSMTQRLDLVIETAGEPMRY